MSTDRSLTTLLRALQSGSNSQDVSRLLGVATTLLTLLSSPLNVTLLASQLLSAPAIWHRPDGLRTTIRTLSVFNSASLHLLQRDEPTLPREPPQHTTRLTKEEWAIAIIKGADDRSPRWRHLLVLCGLLLGFEGQYRQGLSMSLRGTLENAVVTAANLALEEVERSNELVTSSIAIMLASVFDLLNRSHKENINYDLLLPILVQGPYFSKEGLYSGYLLSTMDVDVVQTDGSKFDWSTMSSTYVQLQRVASGPLVSSLGSLSRLTAVSVEKVQDIELLVVVMDDLSAFTRSLRIQWRQNKLSEIDIMEEAIFLSNETLRTSLPLLWRVLKSSMFAIVVILQSLLGRTIRDTKMPLDTAPFVAMQSLQMLRDLYFISSRLGANAFTQYTFVYLAALDILSQYPRQADTFLRDIKPTEAGSIPQHPLDRCLDLYFLNTAEHFTLVLNPRANEELLIAAATPYLGVGGDQRLLEIFEAAHSTVLAVLAAPQNADLVVKHIYTYVEVLFKVFPRNLSSQQYRVAIKTLIRITSPPSIVSQSQPFLPSVLLELILERVKLASSEHLDQSPHAMTLIGNPSEEPVLSEQSVLILAMIDALPFLPNDMLEEWLPIVAETLKVVQDQTMLQTCRQRFWEAVSGGEMDVTRAAQCVTWWSTNGGREMVLYGNLEKREGPFMSGALGEASKL